MTTTSNRKRQPGPEQWTNVLQTFLLRARRIEQHTLVQDLDKLLGHARGSFVMNVALDGQTTFRRELPPEQDFESLAARIRPLVLLSEPIHYAEVLKTMTSLVRVKDEAKAAELARTHVKDLGEQWRSVDIEKPMIVQAYSYQSENRATGKTLPRVTDTQLAAAWIYGDLVHANPKPRIQDAMQYPLKERYAAAVGVFSRLALLTLRTKTLIRELIDQGLLELPETPWSDPVSVPDDELVDTGMTYMAPIGTPFPEKLEKLPQPWSPLNIPELMAENDPTRRGAVQLVKDGEFVDEYDAVTIRRVLDGAHGELDILVAQGLVFHLPIDFGDDGIAQPGQATVTSHPTTNSSRLEIERFQLAFEEADTAILELNGQPLVSINDNSSSEVIQHTRQLVDIFSELVRVETLLGQNLPLLKGDVSHWQRLDLRILRLLLEGKLVAATRRAVRVRSDNDVAPQVVVLSPGTVEFGDLHIPCPRLYMGHPQMTTFLVDEDAEQSSGENPNFEASVPEGQLFLLWDPQRTNVRPDFLGMGVALWNLEGASEGVVAVSKT